MVQRTDAIRTASAETAQASEGVALDDMGNPCGVANVHDEIQMEVPEDEVLYLDYELPFTLEGFENEKAAIKAVFDPEEKRVHVDSEGHLIPINKVRGRKKSLHSLVDYMEQKMGSYREKNDIVFISHGDSLEDANLVAEDIKERFGITTFLCTLIWCWLSTLTLIGQIF